MTYDCTACGLCCALPKDKASSGPTYLALREGDSIPWWLRRRTEPKQHHVRFRKGRCVALRGTPCVSCTCAVYETRPLVCRAFQPGHPLCLYLRRRAGLPVAKAAERKAVGAILMQGRIEAERTVGDVASAARISAPRLIRIETGVEIPSLREARRAMTALGYEHMMDQIQDLLAGKMTTFGGEGRPYDAPASLPGLPTSRRDIDRMLYGTWWQRLRRWVRGLMRRGARKPLGRRVWSVESPLPPPAT